MTRDRLTVAVMLDAFRWDYRSDGACLFDKIVQRGVSGAVAPTFGFECDAAFFAGLYPDQADGGAHYWRDPSTSPFVFVKRAFGWSDFMRGMPAKVVRRFVSKIVQSTSCYKYESIPSIPFSVIDEFAPVRTATPWSEVYAANRTVVQSCVDVGKEAFVHGSPVHNVVAEVGSSRVLKYVVPPVEFAFWHIGDLDTLGHLHGPDSVEVRSRLAEIENILDTVILEIEARYDQVTWIVFGDHGMLKADKFIDVGRAITEAGLEMGRDVLYFLDSTMARLWLLDETLTAEVEGALIGLQGLVRIGKSERDKYHLNYGHNRFGDMIYLAQPGYQIFPNYFQRDTPVLGMHGYAPDVKDQQSRLLIRSPVVEESIELKKAVDMRRLYQTFMDSLGIKSKVGFGLNSIL